MRILVVLRTICTMGLVCAQIGHAQDTKKGSESTASKPAVAISAADKQSAGVDARLTAVEGAINKKDSDKASIMPAVFGLLGVLIGGLINAFVANGSAKNTRRIADDAASHAKKLADAKAMQERELAENRA